MKKQFGLSLVELMISITLGLILMAGVIQVFLSSKTVFTTQQGMSRIQETGRLAIDFIGRDLRMSSYYGCVNTIDPAETNSFKITNTLTGLTGLHMGFEHGLIGYTVSLSGSTVTSTLPNGVEADLGTNFDIQAPSDILVIRGSNERGIPIPSTNPSTATTAMGYTPETSLTGGCVEGFCNGGIAVITNCQQGRFFKISATPVISSNLITLTHADTWPTSVSASAPTLPDIYTAGNILPVHTIVYFVAKASGNTIPSLWQQTDGQTPIEILQGVENLSLRYRASTPSATYQAAASVTNWDAITSVQVEILVRGLEQRSLDDVQPYTFAGATVTPTDRIIRKVFKATFSIRSRSN